MTHGRTYVCARANHNMKGGCTVFPLHGSITIERVKPDKPIPTCVREYGVPFLSKYVSEQMMRLQAHGFQWEDEPLEVLLQRYPRCKTALQWWCGERYSDEDGVQKISRFSIYRNRFLK